MVGDETPVVEKEIDLVKDSELQCTPHGQVLFDLKGRSAFDLNAERARLLRENRPPPPSSVNYATLLKRVLGILEIPTAKVTEVGRIERERYRIERQIYNVESGIALPGLHYIPAKPSDEPAILYLHERGKEAADLDGTLPRLATAGRNVFAIDLRGWGETAPGKISEQSYFGNEFTESFLSLHLNRPLLGQRVLDALAVVQAITDTSQGIEVHGVGSGGLVALHVAVLDPRIRKVELHSTLASWQLVAESPISYEQLADVVPNVLASYDLPELAASLAPRPLTIRNPLDPQNQPLLGEVRRAVFAPVKAAFEKLDRETDLSITGSVFASAPILLQDKGAGEGPAWHPQLGLLTSGPDGHIYQRDRASNVSIYRRDAGSNGLMFDRQGRLVICEPVRRRVSRVEDNGDVTVLAERYDGKRFNQPNDLTMDSRGRIYFSDPCYGDRSALELVDAQGRKVEGVYRIDPDGKVSRIITHEVDRPNGLVVSHDDKHLFVADNNNGTVGGSRKLWRFDLRQDGTIAAESRALLYDWKATRGPDGLKLDALGRLYVAAGLNKPNPPHETHDQPTAGIYVFSPEGNLLDFAPIPRDETTNCAFGDEDLKSLFVTAGGTLWRIETITPGKSVRSAR